MKRLELLTGIVLMLTGCVKETTWPLKEASNPAIIVEATLTDEVKAHEVTLAFSVSELNATPRPVTGAGVVVSNEDSAWTLAEKPGNPGTYLTPAWFAARTGKTYTLLVSDSGRVYSAKASMVPGAYFPELHYSRDEPTGMYHVDWVASAFSTSGAAMWEVLLDWSDVPGYEQADSSKTHGRMLFYTLPTLDVSQVFAPQVEAVGFPAGTVITERRYSLSHDHAEFIRELMLETSWSGGLFPSAAANVHSNLSNGAFGFFGVCAVTELSLVVH